MTTSSCKRWRSTSTPTACLFEVRHTDARGKSYGYVITSAGLIKKVDFRADEGDGGPLTRDPVRYAKLLSASARGVELETRIPEATLRELRSLIAVATGDALGCDERPSEQFQTTYAAWTLDEQGNHARTVLASSGRITCANAAPDAQILVAWLYRYVGAESTVFNRASTGCRLTEGRLIPHANP